LSCKGSSGKAQSTGALAARRVFAWLQQMLPLQDNGHHKKTANTLSGAIQPELVFFHSAHPSKGTPACGRDAK